jgi:hypothetical protein
MYTWVKHHGKLQLTIKVHIQNEEQEVKMGGFQWEGRG